MTNTHINNFKEKLILQGFTPEEVDKRVSLASKFHKWVHDRDQDKGVSEITTVNAQPPVDYKKNSPVFHVLLLLLIIITAVMVTFGAVVAAQNSKPTAIQKRSYSPNTRTLSFSGKLTSADGIIIAEKTTVILNLYNSSIGGRQVYSTGVCKVIPNIQGVFETTIGGACGSPIREDVFSNNPAIYVGIKIANDPEMTPRIPVTSNAQAQSPIEQDSIKIDENGEIVLDSETPAIRTTLESANFAISSAGGVLIQSALDGDITLSASESGQIKFLVGGQQVGTIKNNGDIDLTGNILPSNTGIQDIGSSNNRYRNLYVDNIYPGLSGISGYLKREGNTLSTSSVGDELILGSSNRTSSLIKLSPFKTEASWFNAGNFGIGTTNPTFNLDVAGTTRIGGNITFNSSALSFLNSAAITMPGNTVNALAFQTDMLSLDTKNNRIGIGTIAPVNKLTVADSQGSMSSLWVENADSGPSAKGISVKLGFTGAGNTSNEFITFIKGNGEVQGKIQSNGASGVSYSSGGGDFAEYFLKDINLPVESSTIWSAGTVVCIVADGMVRPCDNESGSILGVISNNAAFVGNNKGENNNKYVLVGLVGQLGVQVDSRSGIIKSGDPLTSTTPGVVKAATQSGRIIGFAKEAYSGAGSRTIQATIQPGYFEIGSKTIAYDGLELDQKLNTKLLTDIQTQVSALADKFREKITTPVVETDMLTAKSADVKTISTNIIAPSENKDIIIDVSKPIEPQSSPGKGALSSLLIKGVDNHTVASIDAAGNASFSGTLTANSLTTTSLQTNEATISGTLTAERVEATNITDIENKINDLKNQPVPDYRLYEKDTSVFKDVEPIESLTVLGKTSLYDVAVANSLLAGNISISNDSITGLSFELKLNALQGINLLDGAVMVSRDGNLTTKGELIAQKGIRTNHITALETGDKVNIDTNVNVSGSGYFTEGIGVDTFIADAKNTTSQDAVTAAISTNAQSAGTGSIPAGKTNVIIYNEKLSQNSLVYLTSTSKTENQPIYVSRKEPCEDRTTVACESYFIVTIDSPIKTSATFNWWIIN